MSEITLMKFKSYVTVRFFLALILATAAMIPVFITGHPVITKWGDYSTFVTTVAEYLSDQLREC